MCLQLSRHLSFLSAEEDYWCFLAIISNAIVCSWITYNRQSTSTFRSRTSSSSSNSQLTKDFFLPLHRFPSSSPPLKPKWENLWNVLEIIVGERKKNLKSRSWYLFHFRYYLRFPDLKPAILFCVFLFVCLTPTRPIFQFQPLSFFPANELSSLNRFFLLVVIVCERDAMNEWIQLANNTSHDSTAPFRFFCYSMQIAMWHFNASQVELHEIKKNIDFSSLDGEIFDFIAVHFDWKKRWINLYSRNSPGGRCENLLTKITSVKNSYNRIVSYITRNPFHSL